MTVYRHLSNTSNLMKRSPSCSIKSNQDSHSSSSGPKSYQDYNHEEDYQGSHDYHDTTTQVQRNPISRSNEFNTHLENLKESQLEYNSNRDDEGQVVFNSSSYMFYQHSPSTMKATITNETSSSSSHHYPHHNLHSAQFHTSDSTLTMMMVSSSDERIHYDDNNNQNDNLNIIKEDINDDNDTNKNNMTNKKNKLKTLSSSLMTPKMAFKEYIQSIKELPLAISSFHKLFGLKLKTLDVDSVPLYMIDNNFIIDGYRCHYSYEQSWISLFRLHNETGNIWTHLFGSIIFITLAFVFGFATDLHPLAQFSDRLILSLFLACGAMTMFLSGIFHLHLCVSETAYKAFGCLDYSGISALILASGVTITYYIFLCDLQNKIIWLTLLSLANTVGVIGPFFPLWRTPAFRVFRTVAYVSSGAFCAAPIIHYMFQYGFYALPKIQNMEAWGFILSFVSYLIGVFIYVFRIPERFHPGKFDYILHSHQIWHTCVVIAAYLHFQATVSLMKWRLDQGTCEAK